MSLTVIQHVLKRLKEIGVTDVFGVPGDYAFPVNDAICLDPDIRWVGCCNELNAAYAADGYARIKGVAALCTTYGVGELSAVNGIAGSYAEHLPVFHLVGTPSMSVQSSRALMHHTLGTGDYDLFRRMSEPVVSAHAVMTPQNVAHETERLIFEALYHRRPVYMSFPADLANQPVLSEAQPLQPPKSHKENLEAAAATILETLKTAKSACVLAGIMVARIRAQNDLLSFITASDLPFATMFMGKSVLDEQHPNYIGLYDGALLNEEVRELVEGSEVILNIGSPLTDFNTGAFTAKLDPSKMIDIGHHHTTVRGKRFANVELGDLLRTLSKQASKGFWRKMAPGSVGIKKGSGSDPITVDALYPRWAEFLKANDIIIAETGTASMGLGFARLPDKATFHNQTLWGSIGWATPAAFGAAVSSPKSRVVLFTGDGSHQLTVQEISQFGRLGLKPVIFVLNNSGYLIERLLCKDPGIEYNDIASWRYTELPHAFGCDGWLTARVTTCDELDSALAAAIKADTGVYIEVITDAYEASPLAKRLHDSLKSLYRA